MVPKAKQAPPELAVVGRRQKRLDGFEKVSGRSVFTDDVRLPGMLHGKILRSPHARARILAIDTSKAAALPGVKIVLTGEDAPELMFSQHQPVFAREVVNYVGEEVAAVAAADLVTADEAVRLIRVEYEA
jgi:CO/xanthine dehydrogenase Mo-binding subunit